MLTKHEMFGNRNLSLFVRACCRLPSIWLAARWWGLLRLFPVLLLVATGEVTAAGKTHGCCAVANIRSGLLGGRALEQIDGPADSEHGDANGEVVVIPVAFVTIQGVSEVELVQLISSTFTVMSLKSQSLLLESGSSS